MKNISFENKRKHSKAYDKAFERRRLELVKQYCPTCKYMDKLGVDCHPDKPSDCPMIKAAIVPYTL